MKNVLILTSNFNENITAIINYFKSNDSVKFKLMCNNKNKKNIKKAQKFKIETFFVENEELDVFFEDHKYDLVVICDFSTILNKKILETNCFINIHSSLLPKHKGLNPLEKAYINNDLKTGITIYYPNEFLCEGEIIYQHELEINPKWSIKKLYFEIKQMKNYYYPRIVEKLLGLNVLVIGENISSHAIVDNISKSKYLSKIYLANCNNILKNSYENIFYTNLVDLAKKAKKKNINLAIVNDETLFDKGIVEIFSKYNIKTFGANKKNLEFQSSNLKTKKLLQKNNIKIAPYTCISNKKDIDKIISYFKNPIIKANGLSKRKGKYFNQDKNKVKNELYKYLDGKFEKYSIKSLVEEKLFGTKATLVSFWDGKNFLHFPLLKTSTKTNEELYCEGSCGFSPFEFTSEDEKKIDLYKTKLNNMFLEEKYEGSFVFVSSFLISDDIYILDCYTYLSDVEASIVLNSIQDDWLEIFFNCSNRMLNSISLAKNSKTIYSTVLFAKGYPLKTRLNIKISNLNPVNNSTKVYFSDIIEQDGNLYSNGGKILSVVSNEKNEIYRYLSQINFEEKDYKTFSE